MYPTTYHRPASAADAAALFAAQDDAAFLSGGHTLLPTMKLGLARPAALIDLCAIPGLSGVSLQGTTLTIGATTRHADVAAAAEVQRLIPALAGLAGSIGDRQVRHRGTIGGSVANNDPSADYPAAVLGLGATVRTDRRSLAADDYFVGLYTTALEPGEIVLAVDFPLPLAAGYAKFRSPSSRYAVAAVFVARTAQGVRVAVTGAGAQGVFRATAFEAALDRDFSAAALAGLTVPESELVDDLNGSAAYRANLVAVLARHAVQNLGRVVLLK